MRRVVSEIAVCMLLIGVVASPAAAAVTSAVTAGALVVQGDGANDEIFVVCTEGSTKVNDDDPGSGPATCSSITSVEVSGGGGNDRLVMPFGGFANIESVELNGQAGADRLESQDPEPATLNGGSGDDTILAGAADSVSGGDGLDAVVLVTPSSGDNDTILTADSYTIGAESGTLTSVEFAQTVMYSRDDVDGSAFPGKQLIIAFDGSQRLVGGPAADRIEAGDGADIVIGGGGRDELAGQAGDDRLLGLAGNDDLEGGRGRDLLKGGAGDDRCDGGLDADTIRTCER